MKLKSQEIYHVYNRGNNRQRLFYDVENYPYFLAKVRQYLLPHCDMLAYCLMPNHFHLLIHANKRTIIPYRSRRLKKKQEQRPVIEMTRFSRGIQLLLSTYAKAVNKRYARSGSLFRQNTKWKRTSSEFYSDDYSLQCFMYIHNNPVLAGLAQSPEDWLYSSAREYLGLQGKDCLCNLELGRKLLYLERNEIRYLNGMELPPDVIKKIFR